MVPFYAELVKVYKNICCLQILSTSCTAIHQHFFCTNCCIRKIKGVKLPKLSLINKQQLKLQTGWGNQIFTAVAYFGCLCAKLLIFSQKKTSQLLIFSRFVAYFFTKKLVSCLIFHKVWLVSKKLLIEGWSSEWVYLILPSLF